MKKAFLGNIKFWRAIALIQTSLLALIFMGVAWQWAVSFFPQPEPDCSECESYPADQLQTDGEYMLYDWSACGRNANGAFECKRWRLQGDRVISCPIPSDPPPELQVTYHS